MPAAGGRRHQITVTDRHQLLAFHQKLLRAFDDQPDLGEVGVKVAPHIIGRRRNALLRAQDGDVIVVVAQPYAALLAALTNRPNR